MFDNKIIHKFCYEVNGYTISVSRINTTIHMYLTVWSGISPLGDVLVTTYDGGVMVVNMNMRGSWIRCNIIERKIPDSQRAKDMV